MNKIRRFVKILSIISPEYLIGAVGIIFFTFMFALSRFIYYPTIKPASQPEIKTTPFDGLVFEAHAIYVYDVVNKKEIYSRDGDGQLPLASLTKVMMAVTALSLLPENTVVTINKDFLRSEGDSGLMENERWRLGDLLNLTLLQSSNDGASAIASVAGSSGNAIVSDKFGRGSFVDAMNKKSEELGLTQTYFLNPTGLDENLSVSGAYGSAHDVAVMFSYAVDKYPQIFDATRSEGREFLSMSSLKHAVKNTNIFVAKIPSLLASKTGYTDLAGGNLVIAFDAGVNHPVVISVLGSTEEGRFKDTEKLVWATLEYLSKN